MHQTLKENSLTNASYETPFDDMPATPGDNPLMTTYTVEQCEEIFRQAINCCDKQFLQL